MHTHHHLLPALLAVPQSDLRAIKKALSAEGVNARGWRLYADYGDALFATLGPGWADPRHPQRALGLLRLLASCEMDVLPPPELLRSLAHWQLPDDEPACVPVGLFRVFWKACVAVAYKHPQQPNAVDRFVRAEITPCARWYFSSGQHLDASANWRHADWDKVRSRWQQALYEEMTRGTKRPRFALAGAEWPVFIARVACDGLVFQALHNETALRAEGERMSHCVGGYAERCRRSMLRIYAISDQRSGRRVGTVSAAENGPGRWSVDELKGPCNADVAPWVEHAADAVARSLMNAYFTMPAVRHEMNAFRRATKCILSG